MSDPGQSQRVVARSSAVIAVLLLAAIGGMMQAARSFAMDAGAGPELAFGYLLLVAYFTSKLVSKVGLPKLTGYLIAGVLSGPAVLQLVDAAMTHQLKIVSTTATAILALEGGAELDFRKVRPVMKTLRGLMLYTVIGAMVVLTGVVFLLRPWIDVFAGLDLTQGIVVSAVIGVCISAQSPSVGMAMLAETKAEGPLSRMILACVVVSDLLVILCFSIALAMAGTVLVGEVDVTDTVIEVGWELLGSIVFGIAIGMLIGLFLRTIHKGAPLFALLVCVVVAEIGSRMHLDPLIVLLASGIWLRNFSRANAHDLLDSFESAQLPVFLVFFAVAGSNLQLSKLAGVIVPVLVLAGARAIYTYVAARVACASTKAERVVSKYVWLGLLPQSGLSLALVAVLTATFSADHYGAGSTGAFGAGAATLILGVMTVNLLLAPPLLRLALTKSGEAGKKQSVDFAAGH